MPSSADILRERLRPFPDRFPDVRSRLGHFALINYALPAERLRRYIPADRYEIPEFMIGGQSLAMMSAVPFLDIDFHFIHILPFLKWRFGQTNYRVYVIDKRTGQHAVWFFGTTLGSWVVQIPRLLWRIPWHYGSYRINCRYDETERRYAEFRYSVKSDWAAAEVDIQDCGKPVGLCEGFVSMDDMTLILTHPVDGYFHRLDGKLGGYSVWHEKIPCTAGTAKHLYFSLYERLGLLSPEEMLQPHSIFICPETEFKVLLPPRRLSD